MLRLNVLVKTVNQETKVVILKSFFDFNDFWQLLFAICYAHVKTVKLAQILRDDKN